MKRKFYAVVKVTLVREIEFELDDDTPNLDAEAEAVKVAEKEFHITQREDDEPQDEEVEVLECDYAD
jgi:hypothetical protein